MNLKKVSLGLVALLLGFGLVVTQSAFKTVVSAAGHAPVDYYFNGSDYTQASDWDTTQDTEFICTSETAVPCKITVPENTTLQDYLDLHSGDILSVSDGRRDLN